MDRLKRFLTNWLLALAIVFPTTTACKGVPISGSQLLDCGEEAVQQQLPTLLSQVSSILSSGSVNWQDSLDALLTTGGSAVVCAVQVAVSNLEHGTTTPGAATYSAIARGEGWLAAHPNLVRGDGVAAHRARMRLTPLPLH